jgi:hypothetical protein
VKKSKDAQKKKEGRLGVFEFAHPGDGFDLHGVKSPEGGTDPSPPDVKAGKHAPEQKRIRHMK